MEKQNLASISIAPIHGWKSGVRPQGFCQPSVRGLNPGEAAVISLAITERIADGCLDDLDARRLARILGLRVAGSIGVLLAAQSKGEPIEIRRALDNMRRQGIWISDSLMHRVLLAAGK